MKAPLARPSPERAELRIISCLFRACFLGLLGAATVACADEASNPRQWTSPDGRKLAFLRTNPKAIDTGLGAPQGGRPQVDLWISNADGTNARLLLRGTGTRMPETNLSGIEQAAFSPDGRTLYFQTAAWLTSPAIHAVDIPSGRQHLVTNGWLNHVVAGGRFKGNLVVHQHRHFVDAGTYDWYWLLTKEGKDVGPVGPIEGDPSVVRNLKDFQEDDER